MAELQGEVDAKHADLALTQHTHSQTCALLCTCVQCFLAHAPPLCVCACVCVCAVCSAEELQRIAGEHAELSERVLTHSQSVTSLTDEILAMQTQLDTANARVRNCTPLCVAAHL